MRHLLSPETIKEHYPALFEVSNDNDFSFDEETQILSENLRDLSLTLPSILAKTNQIEQAIEVIKLVRPTMEQIQNSTETLALLDLMHASFILHRENRLGDVQ